MAILFLENVKKPNSKRSNRLCENQIGCAFWANMIMFHCYFHQDLWSLMLVLDCNSSMGSTGHMGHLKGTTVILVLTKIWLVFCKKVPNFDMTMVSLIEKYWISDKIFDHGILKKPFIGTLRFHWWRHFVCRHHYIFS